MDRMDNEIRAEIHDQLSKMEQQLIQLRYFSPATKEINFEIKTLLDKCQPLYEQLGGVYISKMNLNYIGHETS